ncbi:MAG: diacylglycerol kinase family lipid kinase [Clostridia bacterium]|nr:diacylglycerol kinase family lipid kinase [Clostridia bacterium]
MNAVFIYNPESGQSKISKNINKIKKTLQIKFGDVEFIETTHSGHAKEIAEMLGETLDYLFVAGGDGTIHEIINGIAELKKRPIIGYIPTGTVNDFARSLSISRNLDKALNTIVNGKPTEIDIMKFNDSYSVYVYGTGIFTKTSYSTKRTKKRIFGKLAYVFSGLKEIFHSYPIKATLKTNGCEITETCSLVLVINSRSVGGFKFNKHAKLDDGKADIVMFKCFKNRVGLFSLLRIAWVILFGLNVTKNNKHYVFINTSSGIITLDKISPATLDGEPADKDYFEFNVIQKHIKILTLEK